MLKNQVVSVGDKETLIIEINLWLMILMCVSIGRHNDRFKKN